jgi:hypothetical protein
LSGPEISVDAFHHLWLFEDPEATTGFGAEFAMVQANIINVGLKPTILLKARLSAEIDGATVSLAPIRQSTPESNFYPVVIPSNGVIKTEYKWRAARDLEWFSAPDEEFKTKYDNRFSRFPEGTRFVVRYEFSNGYVFEMPFDDQHQVKAHGRME